MANGPKEAPSIANALTYEIKSRKSNKFYKCWI